VGDTSATMIDWIKSNDMEYEHIKKSLEKTSIIGGLDLPEMAKHSRRRRRRRLHTYIHTDIHTYTHTMPYIHTYMIDHNTVKATSNQVYNGLKERTG